MSFVEIKELLPTLTPEERGELQDFLGAIDEGVPVEEYRRIKAALEEVMHDPSPTCSIEDLEADLKKLAASHAEAA